MNNKLSKYIQKVLSEYEHDDLGICLVITFIVSGVIILFTSIPYSNGIPVGFFNWIKYLLYFYPVGFILFSYIAVCQLTNLNKVRKRDLEFESKKIKDEKEKYTTLLQVACIPFLNVIASAPILVILPFCIITIYSYSTASKVLAYLFKGYKRALEKIANQNQNIS